MTKVMDWACDNCDAPCIVTDNGYAEKSSHRALCKKCYPAPDHCYHSWNALWVDPDNKSTPSEPKALRCDKKYFKPFTGPKSKSSSVDPLGEKVKQALKSIDKGEAWKVGYSTLEQTIELGFVNSTGVRLTEMGRGVLGKK